MQSTFSSMTECIKVYLRGGSDVRPHLLITQYLNSFPRQLHNLELWARRNHGEIESAGHIKASIISCAFTWSASGTSDMLAYVFHTMPPPRPPSLKKSTKQTPDCLTCFNPVYSKITNRQETPRHMARIRFSWASVRESIVYLYWEIKEREK